MKAETIASPTPCSNDLFMELQAIGVKPVTFLRQFEPNGKEALQENTPLHYKTLLLYPSQALS